MNIEVCNVTKKFGNFTALDDVSLQIPTGELIALLGPSGSGKTTLLRLIAGLEFPDRGEIRFNGKDVSDRSVRRRHVGFVFQHYALFRHMTVFENVAFGLRVQPRRRRPAERAIRAKVAELLKLVQLDSLAPRYPSQLSGGQRQRVALARALAVEPLVLLLDEPFGALDAKVRQDLRRWLRRLHDELHITSVFVTHDQEEALEVADRVVVINHGKVEQVGSPEEVYHHPANAFVMDFLGNVNVFHGRVEGGKAVLGNLELAYPDYPHAESRPATVYVRPHELDIKRDRNGVPCLRADVLHVNPAGSVAKVQLLATESGVELNVELSLEKYEKMGLKAGDTVFVHARRARVFVPDFSDYSI